MKKSIKRILSSLLFVCLLLAGLAGFRYLVTDDVYSYTRIMMHQLYESDTNIDVLFLGSSHVYRSLIPEITDAGLNAYTFNGGSSSQQMDGSYALLCEAIDHHDISTVYLELYYAIACSPAWNDRTDMTSTYILSDYMRNPFNRTRYLLQASSKEYYGNSFLIAKRNIDALLDPDIVYSLLRQKSSDFYKNYQYPKRENAEEYYVDRGYIANIGTLSADQVWVSDAYGTIDLQKISQDYLRSLQQIVTLCRNRNIELVFFIAPMPEATLLGKENYDDYLAFAQQIASELNVPLYDFNLCKTDYFDTQDRNLFKDWNHLNQAGAEIFSQLFSDFFSGKLSHDQIFYASLSEKVLDEKPAVYGLAGPSIAEDGTIQGYIITNHPEAYTYKIGVQTENKSEILIQDFSSNRYFSLPPETQGTLLVFCKAKGSQGTSTCLEVQI